MGDLIKSENTQYNKAFMKMTRLSQADGKIDKERYLNYEKVILNIVLVVINSELIKCNLSNRTNASIYT